MVVDVILQYLRLIRIRQWYKNLVIFLPLIFGKQLFNLFSVQQTIIGFFALSLISSSNYILNDIKDREKDKLHPVKRYRPIASGKISVFSASITGLIFFAGGMLLSASLSTLFAFFALSLFLSTQLYTFILKNEAFADIINISVNFVIRTIAGAFVIAKGFEPYVEVSAWLILCPFFVALFLAAAKRHKEVKALKQGAEAHRAVLKVYSEKMCFALLIISTTLLVISFSLYVIFSPYQGMIYTIPFVLYLILRFFSLVVQEDLITNRLDLIYKDRGILFAGGLICMITLFAVYFM